MYVLKGQNHCCLKGRQLFSFLGSEPKVDTKDFRKQTKHYHYNVYKNHTVGGNYLQYECKIPEYIILEKIIHSKRKSPKKC